MPAIAYRFTKPNKAQYSSDCTKMKSGGCIFFINSQ